MFSICLLDHCGSCHGGAHAKWKAKPTSMLYVSLSGSPFAPFLCWEYFNSFGVLDNRECDYPLEWYLWLFKSPQRKGMPYIPLRKAYIEEDPTLRSLVLMKSASITHLNLDRMRGFAP